eukprot:TRINITY_DN2592_c0_g4_i1.p1 TRINITY_DN2592_c0_g4~~TRINITY_DN2592_c0_g4_i1.p1  ORF type:complete len:1116 (+),score=211.94 TRINITY_DN2592_c0_g4_i1:72-3419(+)
MGRRHGSLLFQVAIVFLLLPLVLGARRTKTEDGELDLDELEDGEPLKSAQQYVTKMGMRGRLAYLVVPIVLACFAWWLVRVDRNEMQKDKEQQEEGVETEPGSTGGIDDRGHRSRPTTEENNINQSGETLNFTDAELERRWLRHSHTEAIKIGATTLAVVSFFLAMHVTYKLYKRKVHSCMLEQGFLPFNIQIGFLTVMFGTSIITARTARDDVYAFVITFLFIYMLASRFPPFENSCQQVQERKATCSLDAEIYMLDCSLQGRTALQMLISWILILPVAIPSLKMMYQYVSIWLIIFYPGASLISRYLLKDSLVYHGDQIVISFLILVLAFAIALGKKYYMEKGARNKFLTDMKLRHTSEKLFGIFEQMMPQHIIHDMIQKPGEPFAESYGQVSILFVLIADFDECVRGRSPEKVLELLNDQFSRIDRICANCGVTKVETVGEEYVCCVGVTPDDERVSRKGGHRVLLGRLFQAANQILDMDSEVRFKMGIHTGSIVAGVIGNKLPRYRLFGDTINTAARMMQKSPPGVLQFGEATHVQLPASVAASYKGEVEMKGKGKVKVYTFDSIVRCQQEKPSRHHFTFKFKLTSASNFSNEEADDMDKFDNIMRHLALNDEPIRAQGHVSKISYYSGGLLLSEAQGFTAKMENEWLHYTHANTILKKLALRIDRQAIALCLLTAFEIGFLNFIAYRMEQKQNMDEYPGLARIDLDTRFDMVFRARIVCFCILMLLRWVTVTPCFQTIVMEKPVTQQAVFILAYAVMATCMFHSYDMLAFSEDATELAKEENRMPRSSRDQAFILLFVLAYHYISMQFTTYLVTAACFFGLVVYLCFIHEFFFHFLKRMNMGTEGKILFIANVLLNCVVAHAAEQGSRARWKARQRVQMMEERIESILNTLMPPLVVEQLRSLPPNLPPPSHAYEHATISQADLCGFTKLSATRTPNEVVTFIGELFGAFDKLTDKYGIYKVETVGDAYIAGMAEHTLTRTNSPTAVTLFGLDMIEAVHEWSQALGGDPVTCRVGIHHGACIGGIVGTGMQRYHIFGEMMAGVEVLESTALEAHVQVSKALKAAVEAEQCGESPPFGFTLRTEKQLVTSKGEVHDYDEVGGPTYIVDTLS